MGSLWDDIVLLILWLLCSLFPVLAVCESGSLGLEISCSTRTVCSRRNYNVNVHDLQAKACLHPLVCR